MYRITRGGVSEAYCPFNRCTPEDGMEKTWKTADECERVAGNMSIQREDPTYFLVGNYVYDVDRKEIARQLAYDGI